MLFLEEARVRETKAQNKNTELRPGVWRQRTTEGPETTEFQ